MFSLIIIYLQQFILKVYFAFPILFTFLNALFIYFYKKQLLDVYLFHTWNLQMIQIMGPLLERELIKKDFNDKYPMVVAQMHIALDVCFDLYHKQVSWSLDIKFFLNIWPLFNQRNPFQTLQALSTWSQK